MQPPIQNLTGCNVHGAHQHHDRQNTPRETWALMHAADLEQNNSCSAAAGDNDPRIRLYSTDRLFGIDGPVVAHLIIPGSNP